MNPRSKRIAEYLFGQPDNFFRERRILGRVLDRMGRQGAAIAN
jgi:hypothetical protein